MNGVGDGNRAALVAVGLLLAAMVWAVFGQTLRFDFINYDDDEYVYDNPVVQIMAPSAPMNSTKKPHPRPAPPEDLPFSGSSQWYSYRCLSCDHTDWVEDIIVGAFPPERPGGFPVVYCPKCNGDFRCNESTPSKSSFEKPPSTQNP